MEDLKEFRRKVLKLNNRRNFKILNSYTTRDIYRWCLKNKFVPYDISESQFGNIIKELNSFLVKKFLEQSYIRLPYKMGTIELRRKPIKLKIKDGRVFTNRPVDWYKTLELWNNDDYCYKNKILVRKEYLESYKIIYNKASADYSNNTFYKFRILRTIRNKVSEKLTNKEIDALYELCEHKDNNG